MPAHPNTLIMRAAEKEIFRRFSALFKPLGFEMTKMRFWTRIHGEFEESVYLHRGGMTYGAPFSTSTSYRIHLAVRSLKEEVPGMRPETLVVSIPPKGYHFGFNAKNEATFERCVTDLHRYCLNVADPWFKGFRDS